LLDKRLAGLPARNREGLNGGRLREREKRLRERITEKATRDLRKHGRRWDKFAMEKRKGKKNTIRKERELRFCFFSNHDKG